MYNRVAHGECSGVFQQPLSVWGSGYKIYSPPPPKLSGTIDISGLRDAVKTVFFFFHKTSLAFNSEKRLIAKRDQLTYLPTKSMLDPRRG